MPAAVSAVGAVIDYDFAVTNTGNVTLTDPITVADPVIEGAGGAVTCPAPPLAPGATATCTGSHTGDPGRPRCRQRGQQRHRQRAPGADPGRGQRHRSGAAGPGRWEVVKTPQDLPAEDFIVGAVVSYYLNTATNYPNNPPPPPPPPPPPTGPM